MTPHFNEKRIPVDLRSFPGFFKLELIKSNLLFDYGRYDLEVSVVMSLMTWRSWSERKNLKYCKEGKWGGREKDRGKETERNRKF